LLRCFPKLKAFNMIPANLPDNDTMLHFTGLYADCPGACVRTVR
jgi:hypothetical protein